MKRTSDKEQFKTKAQEQVELQRRELFELSRKIHANPELGFQEEKAITWLTDYLEQKEFHVDRGIGGLPTAFRANFGQGKPVIALLAEYDALPDIGHACGHNIIAASSVGAAVASKFMITELGGTVQVLGTPGEEVLGGKIIMVEAGVFNEVDIAMLVHPGTRDMAITQALACVSLEIEFVGHAAHAAACPEQGINALEAMILSFNAIDALRQHVSEKVRIHGIITHGGKAANVVPALSTAHFLVRAHDTSYLEELKERVLNCFTAAALATGCRLKYHWGEKTYEPMNINLTLARLFSYNLELLGRKAEIFQPRFGLGSTDMGNVSQIVPSLHPSIAIASSEISTHSAEFAQAAISERGNEALLDAAKALAMTIADLLCDPEVLTETKKEFHYQKSP